ncbi:hypothetical protein Thermo_01672 [Thermoplasmatales archaeon]|nr:hypothetical protein Thermo_01672 [Thermoplasmatales archaeon]
MEVKMVKVKPGTKRRMKISRLVSIVIVFLFLSSALIIIHSPNISQSNSVNNFQVSNSGGTSYSLNTAYLNSTLNYYTKMNNTSLQSSIIEPRLNANNWESWSFSGEPIGTMFNVGDYQYWAGSPVGYQSYKGTLLGFALAFFAGVDNNGNPNAGTVYATIYFSNPNTGKEIASYVWTDSIDTTYPINGNLKEIFIYPYWDPTVPTNYYKISLYVEVTPNTNYVDEPPIDLFTYDIYGIAGIDEDYSMYGWTYSGITNSFPINVPNNTSAFQFSYNSTEPIQVDIGGITSSQTKQDTITFYSNSYKSGQFQDVLGDPNVPNISVTFRETNIVVANSSILPTLTSSSLLYPNQNWFNSTYVFTTDTPNGALNGKIIDGKQWNTSWHVNISHIKDYNFNSSIPLNNFYINGNFLSYPNLYNNFSSSLVDSTNLAKISYTDVASNLVNYYPILVSSYESNTTVFITQPLTVIVNTSENISGEQSQVNLQWGDGSQNMSIISSADTFSFSHTYLTSGNYTPTVSVVNFPNDPYNTSLSISSTPLSRIDVKAVPISFSASITDVIPHEPVTFTVNVTNGVFPQSYNMLINYGDNNTTNHVVASSFVLNTSYSDEGIYSPFIELTSSGNIVEKVYGPKIIVSPINTVTFTESDLPSGTEWYLNLSNGQSFSSATSTISFNETNGTYPYTIATINKEYSAPGSSFTVNGAPVSKSVKFLKVTYSVTFTESGLPSGTLWYVNVTSSTGVFHENSTSATISFNLVNGTYTFTNETSSKIYRPLSSSGSFTVDGGSLSLHTVTFTEVIYKVTFTESDPPSGITWYVNLTSFNGTSTNSGPITGSTYSVNLPNSTYSFTMATSDKEYSPSPSSGSFTVNGASVSQSVIFSMEYSVTLFESGLSSGTTWYVNITGQPSSGPITGSSYSFDLINGTYPYTIQTANKTYEPSVSSGSFTVNGAYVSKQITFVEVSYTVTFTESGIPSGTAWYVNGSGMSGHEVSPTNITFMLTNGTYTFTVTNLSSYYTTTSHFTVTINGKNVTETVQYYHWAYIAGSISPGNATLTINGNPVSVSSSGHFNVSITDGSYHVVASENGYTTYYNNFTLNAGNVQNLTIDLKTVSKPSSISSTEIYAIIGVVAAIAAVAGVIGYMRRRH